MKMNVKYNLFDNFSLALTALYFTALVDNIVKTKEIANRNC